MNLINAIGRKNILVVGDVMLDEYDIGMVSRISPEAPVPVLRKRAERCVPGGAADVAVNLAAAGQNAYIMAVIGKDDAGRTLRGLLEKSGIDCSRMLAHTGRTTVKTRFLADNNQQLLRLDVEDTADITETVKERLMQRFQNAVETMDFIVLSDYKKGLLSAAFTQEMIQEAARKHRRVLVDVKDTNVKKYKGAWLLKPNLKELQMLTNMPADTDDEIIDAARRLLRETECRHVLTTCGARGMILTSRDSFYKVRAARKEVFDVTGAGDTAAAYLAACLANGMSVEDAVWISNHAAGIQAGKAGTSCVSLEEVNDALNKDALNHDALNAGFLGRQHRKILSGDGILRFRQLNQNKKIVFTNGCFDILHIGHIRCLQQASQLGDVLVVGLNSDASVRRLKGESRPVNTEADRMELLCALACVDYVAVFEEDTPESLIAAIQPDVLAKGGDYMPQEVAGRDIVTGRGGEVVILPYVQGKSTTNTIHTLCPADRNGREIIGMEKQA